MQNSPSTNPMSPKTIIAIAVTFLVIAAAHGLAQEAKAQQEQNTITFELNKLEPSEKGCRAYIVISNTSSRTRQRMNGSAGDAPSLRP